MGEIYVILYVVDLREIENIKKFQCNGFEEVRGNRIKCFCGGVGFRQEYRQFIYSNSQEVGRYIDGYVYLVMGNYVNFLMKSYIFLMK